MAVASPPTPAPTTTTSLTRYSVHRPALPGECAVSAAEVRPADQPGENGHPDGEGQLRRPRPGGGPGAGKSAGHPAEVADQAGAAAGERRHVDGQEQDRHDPQAG